jgi:uncharacterized phage-associated protein
LKFGPQFSVALILFHSQSMHVTKREHGLDTRIAMMRITVAPRRFDLRRIKKLPKQYTARQIAEYFLAKIEEDEGELISNLKLQKLCYYAQGVGLAVRGEPMFPERIEAWLHGPVVPDLYRHYRANGANAIPAMHNLDLEVYDEADRMILDDVFDFYGQYSASRLRQMTHQEAPWKDAYDDGGNEVISNDALIAYFASEVNDEYRNKYVEISRREA